MSTMGNSVIIAKKEFQDLVNSKLVLIALGLFILFALFNLHDTINFDYAGVNKNLFEPYSVFEITLNYTLYVLTSFGRFVAIVIGFSCIAGERHNNALNVLTTKPLYRDTIINGKIIGVFYFLICVYGVTVLLYTSSFLLLYGNILESNIVDYLARVVLILVISVVYSLIYVSLSMLIALLVKSQALALVLSMMAIVVIDDIKTSGFAGYIKLIANGLFGMNPDNVMINYLSASWLIDWILLDVRPFSPSLSLGDILSKANGYLLALALYFITPTILSYIVFVWRDVR